MSKDANVGTTLQTILNGVNDTVLLSSGSEVGVMVCNGNTLPLLLRFASKISKDLGLSLKDAEGIKDKLLDKVDDISFLLDLVAGYSGDVYPLVGAMTTLQTKERVSELPIDDLIKVISKVMEVNTHFFTERVLPLVRKQMPKQGT